ncbi:MAG TPA: hypothetical protein VF592_05765 [Sphingomonas sp.]|jgi:hypothetical protein|uniref:hypothetical protein n=1 Tax=Sphingomonas sp. TaxID=28214 RepID=UPI002ED7ED93
MTEWNPGRPLSEYEQRMRPWRGDVWVPAFDGVYRLFLPYAQMLELERVCGPQVHGDHRDGKSSFAILAGIPKDGDSRRGGATTRGECLNVIRLALIGGGEAIVRGERVKVSATDAARLVGAHLSDAPLTEVWRLAHAALDARINGRPATPEEFEDFRIPSGPPIPPAWAFGNVRAAA